MNMKNREAQEDFSELIQNEMMQNSVKQNQENKTYNDYNNVDKPNKCSCCVS